MIREWRKKNRGGSSWYNIVCRWNQFSLSHHHENSIIVITVSRALTHNQHQPAIQNEFERDHPSSHTQLGSLHVSSMFHRMVELGTAALTGNSLHAVREREREKTWNFSPASTLCSRDSTLYLFCDGRDSAHCHTLRRMRAYVRWTWFLWC